MRKPIFILSLIVLSIILFASCSKKTDYKAELISNSSNYNTIVSLMTKVHTSVVKALLDDKLKDIQPVVDPAEKVLNEHIAALESNTNSDESINELNMSQLEYLKAEKSMVDEYVKLYQNVDQLSENDLSSIMDKLRGMDQTVTEKLTAWESMQSKFKEKHNIIDESTTNQ